MFYFYRKLSRLTKVAMASILLLAPGQLFALELNRYFSDDMVLQRDKPVKVWGTAEKGEEVTVTFAGQSKSAKADESGRWVITLDAMPANAKPQTMTVGKGVTLKNILVGDVFLFARQTSTDVSLGRTTEGKEAAEKLAKKDHYRSIQIKTSPSREPLDNLKEDATKGWSVVDKKTALTMSAAAYYLGNNLSRDINVPIGIVDLNMGHHFGVAWLSEAGITAAKTGEGAGKDKVAWESENGLKRRIATWDKRLDGYEIVKKTKKMVKWAKSETPFKPHPDQWKPIDVPYSPSVCYHSVIHPLQGLTVKGMLLQLGNDYPFVAFTRLKALGKSAEEALLGGASGFTYKINKAGRMTPAVLPVVADDLRRSLGNESIPLAWIMPPGSDVYEYGIHNREVREVQRRAQAKTQSFDLILPGAKNVPLSGQPAEEALLATRCTQWVLSTFYGAKGPASGPVFDRVEFVDETATIFFKEGTAEGLKAEGDGLEHFELAGGDRDFLPAKAEIVGSTVKLKSEGVDNPMYVRFGWAHRPVQGLVNSAGLPALPFNNNKEWVYDWWPEPTPVELPAEYSLPANKWPKRNYAIINYAVEAGGKHLGPTGLWGTEVGPNLYITRVTPGSPSAGKVLVGDLIYGVDGTEFRPGKDVKFHQYTAAINKAEAVKGGGTMVLNIRRDEKLIEVPIQLDYLGAFSETSPWNCEKNENIVKKAEDYMIRGLRPETGYVRMSDYMYGPWNDTVLFLLATGNPEVLGMARRYMEHIMRRIDGSLKTSKYDKKIGWNSYGGWGISYAKLLFGEYYHLTGDATVLPYYERLLNGTWHKEGAERGPKPKREWVWPPPVGGHGTHPASQMTGTMGDLLGHEAGLDFDKGRLHYNLRHLNDKRAEHGYILYNGYGAFPFESRQIPKPSRMDTVKKLTGHIGSMNGKLGTGAALFSMVDGYEKAVKACSERCVYSFNHTRKGHGGAWFNNFWTPIGAYHAGKEKYQHFMKGQRWWRDLYRDHTGSMWQYHNAKERKKSTLATGFAIHRVAHRKKLRMFGAPRSAFGANPPAYLKEALAAHRQRDYALAETLTQKLLKKGGVPESDLPMVNHFLDSVQMVKRSVEVDLDYTEDALEKKRFYQAKLEVPQLKMVVSPDNPRLKAIVAALESEEAKAQFAEAYKAKQAANKAWREAKGERKQAKKESIAAELAKIDTIVKDGVRYPTGMKHRYFPTFPIEEMNSWRVKTLETIEHSPEGWEEPEFDDSEWREMKPPVRWISAHAGLVRTTFEVKDKSVYKNLYVRAHAYKQRSLQLYLNGELVAKVNNIPKRGDIDFPLTDYALKILKNGENTLAVSAQHGKRWVVFSVRLEGHFKDNSNIKKTEH